MDESITIFCMSCKKCVSKLITPIAVSTCGEYRISGFVLNNKFCPECGYELFTHEETKFNKEICS